MTKLITILLGVVLVSGCNDETSKQEETKTVSWYKQNKPERKAKLAQCKENPGELMMTPNCINARKATKELTSTSGFPRVQ